ncbi:hypothetical protein HanPI659440_Chr16g0649211 [Helianthus annuus]|nr:hypothetical protein HanPI659440_Chr16g0649211 [Helianthus annuus]
MSEKQKNLQKHYFGKYFSNNTILVNSFSSNTIMGKNSVYFPYPPPPPPPHTHTQQLKPGRHGLFATMVTRKKLCSAIGS